MMGSASNEKGKVQRFKQAVTDARAFIRDELWDVNLAALPRMRKLVVSTVRVVHMVVKGFVVDRCGLHASALTYFTLMALVPVLALMLSVSKGFRAQDRLLAAAGLEFDAPAQELIVLPDSKLAELPKEMLRIVQEVFLAVENTNFSTLGIVGMALLFWSAVKMVGRIETTFNAIWGVQKARTLVRKFADYISVLVTFPILLLLATSANAALKSGKLTMLLEERLGPFFWVYQRGLGLSSIVFIILGFTVLYMFMPNTRVRTFPSIIGGAFAGILFLGWQWFYFTVQIGAAKKNPIYGTFAAIPLFLVFVQVGWVLVLFGAEVAFALQNYRTYHLETSPKTLSFATQERLGMLYCFEICREFRLGRKWNATEYSSSHNIPSRITTTVLDRLVDSGVILRVNNGKNDGYVPARDLATLTFDKVERALRGESLKNVERALSENCPEIYRRIVEVESSIEQELEGTAFAEVVPG